MEKQEAKSKGRIPVQFWIEVDEKERVDKVAKGYGDISRMARQGLMTQVAERERLLQTEQELKAAS